MSTPIEVLSIKPMAVPGNLKAFATVRLGDIIIYDCRIVQQPGQKPWVSLPQREYITDGKKRYLPVVELSDPLKREVSRIVPAAWERGGT